MLRQAQQPQARGPGQPQARAVIELRRNAAFRGLPLDRLGNRSSRLPQDNLAAVALGRDAVAPPGGEVAVEFAAADQVGGIMREQAEVGIDA